MAKTKTLRINPSSRHFLALFEGLRINSKACHQARGRGQSPPRPRLDVFVKHWDLIVRITIPVLLLLLPLLLFIKQSLWWNIANEHMKWPENFHFLLVFITNGVLLCLPIQKSEAQKVRESTGVDWTWVPPLAQLTNLVPTGVSFFLSLCLFLSYNSAIRLSALKIRSLTT
jgi:hypothetical protein